MEYILYVTSMWKIKGLIDGKEIGAKNILHIIRRGSTSNTTYLDVGTYVNEWWI